MSRPAQALDQPTLYGQFMDLTENITGEIIAGKLYTQHSCRCVSTPLTMKVPYGNPRITSLPGMLSVLSWQPGAQADAGCALGLRSWLFSARAA